MKTKFLLLALTLLLTGTVNSVIAQAKLTINFSTINTIKGYDHVSRLQVFIDDKEVGVSSEKKQSEANAVTVKVPKGKHTLKCVLWANYQGEWQERTVANEYSFDWIFEKGLDIKKKKNSVKFEFDVDKNKAIEK